MILFQKIKILSKLGEILDQIGHDKDWSGFELGINQEEYENLVSLVNQVNIYNGWFTPDAVKESFKGISRWLTEENLSNWISNYKQDSSGKKTVAIIMAGNIPLVGFHDFISVFLSGNKALVKLSSDDKHLFPAILKTLELFDPEVDQWVEIAEQKLEGFDAVIATGSNNSANYFQTYFGKYPHIIRKNRTSIAVLDGTEEKDDLIRLGRDVFTYFGLGCRNVSQVWIPQDFDLNRIFDAFFGFSDIINHNKYANNYDYNKAVYLMNMENLLDNGFILLKEDDSLHSPLGILHFVRYSEENEIDQFIQNNEENIQAIVGKKYIPFGQAQCPALNDYADGVDTMNFLINL